MMADNSGFRHFQNQSYRKFWKSALESQNAVVFLVNVLLIGHGLLGCMCILKPVDCWFKMTEYSQGISKNIEKFMNSSLTKLVAEQSTLTMCL